MKRCSACQTPLPDDFAFCPMDGAELIDPAAYPPDTMIRNHYRILAKVGKGGMGYVYKARHLVFNELRALKVLHPSLTKNEQFVRRFLREAFVARHLHHPNAVRVDDVDQTEDGRHFIVMEFIDGRMLRDVLRQEAPLAVGRACSIAKQVASALAAACELGIIHRDIKPENIALINTGEGETVKVLDFGITKLREGQLKEEAGTLSLATSATLYVVGTPEYMSPEQVRQNELDGRSDIYSLGMVFYEMLTGGLPFHAESPGEWFLAHVSKPPRPLDDFAYLGIPPAIRELVMKMLEKDRAGRPENATAVIQAIDAYGKEEPPPAIVAAPLPRAPAEAAEKVTVVPAGFAGWPKGSLIVERYRVLDLLAETRMGPVYTALDSAVGGVVVLKLIAPWSAPSAALIDELSQYYQRMQTLQHPYVARTLELSQAEDGVVFLVNEFVYGSSLRQTLDQRGALDVSRSCRIIWEIASALEAGQQLGILHGDIRPEHILLTGTPPSEQTKLIDFSLDRVRPAFPEFQASGPPPHGLVAIPYAPPEKICGQPYLPASDIYSLGIVFYEMLTGRRLSQGNGGEIAQRQPEELPLPIDQVHSESSLPPSVVSLVMKMMQKDPHDRPADAHALLEELARTS